MKFPWEPPEETHALTVAELPSQSHMPIAQPVEDKIKALQRDFAYAVTYTSVLVHSPHVSLQMLVNTPRGQIVPRGECKLTDGSVLEFQDIGMPQPNAPTMDVKELVARVFSLAQELGLGVG